MRHFPTKTKGTLYFGGVPDESDLDNLIDNGVQVIWNLGAELGEEYEMERDHFEIVVHTPIKDYDVPTDIDEFNRDIQKIRSYLEDGKVCFVHCWGGHGRTGMVLACLAILDGYSVYSGLSLAKSYCFGPEEEEQVEFVKSWSRK